MTRENRLIRIVDAFCGCGGATRGLQMAAEALGVRIKIIGVDIRDQPDYCGDEFVKGDAIRWLRRNRRKYDGVWASPPCQDFCRLIQGQRAMGKFDNHQNLIPKTRAALLVAGKPYVMENVPDAPLRDDLELCGLTFGLKVLRHRIFEIEGFKVSQPPHVSHDGFSVKRSANPEGNVYGVYGRGGGRGQLGEWQDAMGIDWTRNFHSIAEAVPPRYSEYIGLEFVKRLTMA